MILVTGGTGLVGAHLLAQLTLKGEQVKAIRRKNSDLSSVKKVLSYYEKEPDELFKKIDWVYASLTDIASLEEAFEDITEVYHCAAMISFKPSDYQIMRRVNIEGTTNMVNLSISRQVNKFCFVSSVAAVENASNDSPMDESDNWSSNTAKSGYAITKYGAEMEVWRASQEGVPVIIVNPGVIIGSGNWKRGSAKLFDKVFEGLSFYTKGVTGFVGVEDVVNCMIELMHSDLKNERFVLVSENRSYQYVLTMIAQELGKKVPNVAIQPWMASIVWRIESLRVRLLGGNPILTRHTARSSVEKHYYSSVKIKTLLGIEFEKLSDSIKRTAHYFLAEH